MDQADLLRHAFDALEALQVPYMLVGSLASMSYGEPRLTQDIDLVVDLRREQVAALCAAFPADEYYVSQQAALDAVTHGGQFNVIHPATGNKIDFLLPRRDAWGRAQLARRQKVRLLPDREGYVARPEDVILGKMWYYQEGGSEKHLRDIAGILRVGGTDLDTAYIDEWAGKLGWTDIWRAVQGRVNQDEQS